MSTNLKLAVQRFGIGLFVAGLLVFTISLSLIRFTLNEEALLNSLDDEAQRTAVSTEVASLRNREYRNAWQFQQAFGAAMERAQAAVLQDVTNNRGLTTSDGEYWSAILKDYKIKQLRFSVAKASAKGPMLQARSLWLALSFGLAILGAFLYMLPRMRELRGIKNNRIFHSSLHNRGWLGIAVGVYLIAFYVLLYFYPEYLVSWVLMVDPLSMFLSGNPASQWFLYGVLYTLAILVMGVRMLIKYRGNPYQMIRTGSVMFFQTAFAFLIPQIMLLLHLPSMDLKNIWPLDFSFFFEYRLNELVSSGYFGLFLLVWGIALVVVAVPLITYFYGKRWYCSWVCGCGGLAETLGDPYRQLSDKRLVAWKVERWMVHGVLVFAIVMTALVLYTYFSGSSSVLFLDSYQVRSWYGFGIGSIFAGVVGTGFYPFMGNRVWCRFGCPLAAYLGLVQRFKSRFRITTNGGQCISCGNCSTYCEMGIDVRAYAQRGQDVVRASCVGCGVCAAVCPRGVLRLENGPGVNERAQELRTVHIQESDLMQMIRERN